VICHDCKAQNHKPCKKRTKDMIASGGYGSCDCQHKEGALIQKPVKKKEDA
jgi:hypothetical protein